uniref:Protein kinase domain-containing protein n=1 Tax=Haplochromis burtoni TaxID=8153 RepID=A0A3Q2V6G6_HAPBU
MFFFLPSDPKHVSATSGQDVALHCESLRRTNDNLIALWTKEGYTDDRYVFHVWNKRLNETKQHAKETKQHADFHGRVQLIDPSMNNGNVSVIVRNVSVADTGLYSCTVVTGETRDPTELECLVALTVTEHGESTMDEDGLPSNLQCSIDIQQSMQDPSMLLGRGGFGIIVETSNVQVAKVNMFPEMADWSLPFIEDQFYRYAHIATEVEEIAIGVSMKHPNILRTFGGYWCDIPQYPLGGRAVIVMERALFSLQEFMARMNNLQRPESSTSTDSAVHLALIPIVELDTLRGLEYLHARHVQHRDLTYRNILVCHQPNRKPVELSFKISDFGTACNYSTPDQQRGNRVHTAPEVLWCLNSTTASDVFSWYCVMWELYTGSPLIEYRRAQTPSEFCKKTYGDSLSKLVEHFHVAIISASSSVFRSRCVFYQLLPLLKGVVYVVGAQVPEQVSRCMPLRFVDDTAVRRSNPPVDAGQSAPVFLELLLQ